ncbi:MAG TPA: hypothetical protein VE753_10505 [Gaiellaceae bacterium]|nr:hypothetical protein [Gaiellaceae bacterium]
MRALVQTVDGVFELDLEEEQVLGLQTDARLSARGPKVGLPRVIATAGSGSTVVAVVDRRPPLAVSHDAGRTWREAGGGLPPGRAVVIAEENPDLVLYAARNRLYLSTDGARFWRALAPELPEIQALAFK